MPSVKRAAFARHALVSVSGLVTTGLLGALAFAGPACEGQTCQFNDEDFGKNDGEGDLLDKNTWESTPVNATWINYPGERTEHLFFGKFFPSCASGLAWAFISADPNPTMLTPGQAPLNYTNAGGNSGEFLFVGPGTISVHNDTCAANYLRVVVYCPTPDSVPPADGGTPLDASGDVTTEASGG